MRPIGAVTVLVLALLPAAASGQVVIASAASEVGNFLRTEETVQVGPGPLDRFQMVRLVKDWPVSRLRGSILFLPPLGSSFDFYEQTDESGAPSTSVAGYFAERGYDVYGYVPRYAGIPAGTCEAGLFDCSVMDRWDLQSPRRGHDSPTGDPARSRGGGAAGTGG